VVQVLADVLGTEIQVVDNEQTCALGSAVFAATACGRYSHVQEAKKSIAANAAKTYHPNPEKQEVYETLYQRYKNLTLN